jgi:2-phospho-L-lactate guanylyltransferase
MARCLGISGTDVVPMTDQPVETWVQLAEDQQWVHFQEYFVHRRTDAAILGVRFDGIDRAQPAPGLLDAVATADLVALCPSNPFVSIAPILAVAGIRDALSQARARGATIAAVSPIIGGATVKGPAARMLVELGFAPSALGVARQYADLVDLFLIDPVDAALTDGLRELGMRPLVVDALMRGRRGEAAWRARYRAPRRKQPPGLGVVVAHRAERQEPSRARAVAIRAVRARAAHAARGGRGRVWGADLGGTLVVTETNEGAALATRLGALALPDPAAGLNAAVSLGLDVVAQQGPGTAALVLPGDVPFVQSTDLEAMIDAAGDLARVVVLVPDADRRGTNALLVRPPRVIEPSFGEPSFERHLRAARRAATAIELDLPNLAVDIDDEARLALSPLRSGEIVNRGVQAGSRRHGRVSATGTRRPDDRPPHVRDRAVVEAEPLCRLSEVAPDDIHEVVQVDHRVRVEGVQVVDRDQSTGHVPLVVERALVLVLDVRLGLVLVAKPPHVLRGVFVAGRLVGIEAQRLVRLDRPSDLFVDIRLDQLRAPVAVVARWPTTPISCSRHARMIFSLWPFLSARLALWSRWFCDGEKRYLKKSSSVGLSGIFGSRGSSPMSACLPGGTVRFAGWVGSSSPDVNRTDLATCRLSCSSRCSSTASAFCERVMPGVSTGPLACVWPLVVSIVCSSCGGRITLAGAARDQRDATPSPAGVGSASTSSLGWIGTLVTTKPGVNSSDSFRNCADWPCSRCCHPVSGTYSGSTTVTVSAPSWRRNSPRYCNRGRVRLR